MQIYEKIGMKPVLDKLGIRTLPDKNTTDGSLIMQFMGILEHWGLVKVIENEGHVPFEKAMNGTTISFLVPDWVLWAIIGFTSLYTFAASGLI